MDASRNPADLLKKLAVAAVSASLGLVLCEVIVRHAAPQRLYRFPRGMFVAKEPLHFALAPNFRGVSRTVEYSTSIRTNALGLREDREYGRKDGGTFRLLAIGDSFTMGVGAEPTDTWVKRLEASLGSGRGATRYEVINAGVPGYNTRQASAYFRGEGLGLEPDAVLLALFVGNDVHDNYAEPKVAVIDGYLQGAGLDAGLLPYRLRLPLTMHSHLYNLVWSHQRRLLDASFARREREARETRLSIYRTDAGAAAAAMWSATAAELRGLRDAARERGVRLAVVVVPEHMQADRTLWARAVGGDERYRADVPDARLVGICRDLGVPALDLLPFVSSGSLYLPLDGHWTSEGHRVAADSILSFLRASRLLPEAANPDRASR